MASGSCNMVEVINMMYISKGIVKEGSTEQRLTVCYGGAEYVLTGKEAKSWLDGRYGVANVPNNAAETMIGHLHRMGLVECEDEDNAVTKYRLLTRCVLVPTRKTGFIFLLGKTERQVLLWLRKAGIRLSTAELVYLIDREVKPSPQLLYVQNRQSLIERIYTKGTIRDNILEAQMEKAVFRDEIVDAILHLISKKRLVVL